MHMNHPEFQQYSKHFTHNGNYLWNTIMFEKHKAVFPNSFQHFNIQDKITEHCIKLVFFFFKKKVYLLQNVKY